MEPCGEKQQVGEREDASERLTPEAAPPCAEKLNVRSHSPTCRTDLEDGHQETPLGLI